MPRTFLVLLVAGFTAAAVAKGSEQTLTSWPIREAPPELRMIISSADVIIVSMQDAMLRKLVEGARPRD